MKLLVGLGNPGLQYERTRHNAGFRVVDRLARRHARDAVARSRFNAAVLEARIGSERCMIMKPMTFMNRSGQAVGEAVRFFKLEPAEDVMVVVDDVALPVGSIRIRAKGSAGGHNGLSDIRRALGTDEWSRCRIGIDPVPAPVVQADYVLGRFTTEQEERLEPAIDTAADAVELFVNEGVIATMNRFNVRVRTSDEESEGESPKGQDSSVDPGWLGGA